MKFNYKNTKNENPIRIFFVHLVHSITTQIFVQKQNDNNRNDDDNDKKIERIRYAALRK